MIFLISFVTMGARIITQREYFAWPVRKWAMTWGVICGKYEIWQQYLMKPIITCCVCMPSLWGICIHLIVFGFSLPEIWFVPLEILSASFLNAFIWKKYSIDKKLKREILHLKKQLETNKSENRGVHEFNIINEDDIKFFQSLEPL